MRGPRDATPLVLTLIDARSPRREPKGAPAMPLEVQAANGCAFTRARCMIAIGIHSSFIEVPMTKGKSGAFRGFQGKPGPAGVPQERKRPAPPPRATARRKASSKGR